MPVQHASDDILKSMKRGLNQQGIRNRISRLRLAVPNIAIRTTLIVGYPGETIDDLKKTRKMIFDLTKRGVDEIAVFIVTPIPGSKIYEKFDGFNTLSNLTFTPTWRKDYKMLSKERLIMYSIFLSTKIIFHPIKIFRQILNFFSKKFDTKMEMVPYKVLKLRSFENAKK